MLPEPYREESRTLRSKAGADSTQRWRRSNKSAQRNAVDRGHPDDRRAEKRAHPKAVHDEPEPANETLSKENWEAFGFGVCATGVGAIGLFLKAGLQDGSIFEQSKYMGSGLFCLAICIMLIITYSQRNNPKAQLWFGNSTGLMWGSAASCILISAAGLCVTDSYAPKELFRNASGYFGAASIFLVLALMFLAHGRSSKVGACAVLLLGITGNLIGTYTWGLENGNLVGDFAAGFYVPALVLSAAFLIYVGIAFSESGKDSFLYFRLTVGFVFLLFGAGLIGGAKAYGEKILTDPVIKETLTKALEEGETANWQTAGAAFLYPGIVLICLAFLFLLGQYVVPLILACLDSR